MSRQKISTNILEGPATMTRLNVSTFTLILFFCISRLLLAGEFDPQQGEWFPHYSKQPNAPKPEDMLLNTDAEPEVNEGFTSLFNGKDLEGWTPKGGACTFEARDGLLVGTCVPGSDSTYLCTNQTDFTDFIFTCDMKWEVEGNSGVMFRARSKPGKKNSEIVFGPQAEMEEFSNKRDWSGGIYGQSCGGYFYPLWLKEHKNARAAIKKDHWNRITVSAKGNIVKTWVNGVPAAHWIDDGSYPKGFFGLQIHKGRKGTVLWKNIRVKRLKSKPIETSTDSKSAKASDVPPNIVLILSDDQAWTDYGFMGHEAIKTPNLDQLARESVTFRRGYVPTALCRPSLATLVTGLYAHQHGITGNDPADTTANRAHAERTGTDTREMLISHIDKHPTVPKILAERGYLSFQCGKWWEGSYQRGGFTHGMTRGFPKRGGRHGDDGLKIGREGMQPVYDFIDAATEADKPFYLWYAPFLPHAAHNPPTRLLKKYEKEGRLKSEAAYYAMCEWFDETCGQLLQRLEERGIADNTLVIYVTDNGWIQGPAPGRYAERSKQSPYEGGTRTPIMFRWPNELKPQERSELCSSIDIVPTLLAATGIEAAETMPGLNLLPQLQSREHIERDVIYGETFSHDVADIENLEASLLHRWVIRGHDKLLLTYDGRLGRRKFPPKSGEPQLFDLQADPHEKVNLVSQKPELVKQLRELLNQWYEVTERQVDSVATKISSSESEPRKREVLQ